MKENLDDKFSHKIKEVLENYQAPFEETLWQNFKKRKHQKSTILILFRQRVALVILLCMIALGVYWLGNQTRVKSITSVPQHKKESKIIQNYTPKSKDDSSKSVLVPNSNTAKTNAKQPKSGNMYGNQLLSKQNFTKSNQIYIKTDSLFQKNESFKSFKVENEHTDFTHLNTFSSAIQNIPNKAIAMDSLAMQTFWEDSIALIPFEKPTQKKNKLEFAMMIRPLKGIVWKEDSYTSPLSLGGGLAVGYPIYRNWKLQSGIILQKQSWEKPATFSSAQVSLGQSFENLNEAKQNPSQIKLWWLEMPLEVAYQLHHQSKASIQVGTGISSYFYLHQYYKATTVNATEELIINPTTGVQTRQITYSVSKNENNALFRTFEPAQTAHLFLQFEYKISPKIQVNFKPFYQISLRKITPERLSIHSMGVQMGLNF